MLSSSGRILAKATRAATSRRSEVAQFHHACRLLSTQAVDRTVEDHAPAHHVLNRDGSIPRDEVIHYPNKAFAETKTSPAMLDFKEHAAGYLSQILNARVYDAAVETQLQEAKNLSMVRYPWACIYWFRPLLC